MFTDSKKIKFLYRCNDCEMIISVDFDEQEDIEGAENGTLKLECACGGHCIVLRN